MTHTIFRLIILVPATLLLALLGVLGVGFARLSIPSFAAAALVIALPVALIVWAFSDQRKRARARDDLNA